MGKESTMEVMNQMKKKARPPNNSLSISTPQNPINYDSTNGRSIRRNPNLANFPPPGFSSSDDDEREEKKSKLVVQLPQSEENDNKLNNQKKNNNKGHSGSGSDSGPEPEDPVNCAKSDGAAAIQEKKAGKAIVDTLHGSSYHDPWTPSESGPTSLLPDKELLIFILDRLQKKDTYGAFSEPVDLDELPDYYEVIEQPMDFFTVRDKLDSGAYKSLQEFEADVYLICSNAMEYNAPGTVYYRQARSIQEIAKRDFENLRREGEPAVVRRGRPPNSKNQNKLLEATTEDKTNGSSSYNLRKATLANRFRSSDTFVSSHKSRNGANYSEWSADWNNEFPGFLYRLHATHILKADMRNGKKHLKVDETRRETYKQNHPLSTANNMSNSIGDMKRWVPAGLNEPEAYANSIARFAADLGPTAWKVASRKIESALPAGTPYGPGWVSESGPYSHPSAGNFNLNLSASDLNTGYAPAPEGLANRSAAYMKTPFPSVDQQNRPVYQSQIRNGFGGMFGYNTTSTEGAPLVSQDVGPTWRNDHFSGMTNHFVRDKAKVPESWNVSPLGYQYQVVGSTSRNDHLSAMTSHLVRDKAKVQENLNFSPLGYQNQVVGSTSRNDLLSAMMNHSVRYEAPKVQENWNISPLRYQSQVVVGSTSRNDYLSAMTSHFDRDKSKVLENLNIPPLGFQNQVVGSTSRNDHLSAMTNRFVQDEANVHGNWTGYQMTGQGYSHGEGEMSGFGKLALPAQQIGQSNVLSSRPDLNVRIQAGSPSSSLQIGSPDLALDL
ncbi:hypothetical protein CASFOL_038056 [Castilleja foliolosa]|uniref:Bromo domain-containing protein n=1 Tax=Castilleja foliolosa TaxID=1961234 RepID=A0ABD3BJZ2_9LAMI